MEATMSVYQKEKKLIYVNFFKYVKSKCFLYKMKYLLRSYIYTLVFTALVFQASALALIEKCIMLFSSGKNISHPKSTFWTCCTNSSSFFCVFYLSLESVILFSVSSIIVCFYIRKEILNELNSTKVETVICKCWMWLNRLNPSC